MLDAILWVIVYLGQALAAFAIIVLWALIIFVVVDEIIGLFRDEPTNTEDGEF